MSPIELLWTAKKRVPVWMIFFHWKFQWCGVDGDVVGHNDGDDGNDGHDAGHKHGNNGHDDGHNAGPDGDDSDGGED